MSKLEVFRQHPASLLLTAMVVPVLVLGLLPDRSQRRVCCRKGGAGRRAPALRMRPL